MNDVLNCMHLDDLYLLYTRHPKIITDSRKAEPGSIFFALKGDNFDGNDFAGRALAAGCAYAVVDRPETAVDDRYILVGNVLLALQGLARMHRETMHIPVIAVTGTNGKTTTKELIKCVLSSTFKVYATSGNLNNHIGVPLTLLDMPRETEIAIVEMGANHAGEIKSLCDIAAPTHGLITNIGKAHLEGFGGLDGVKRAKKELYDYLNEHGGTIFFNETNPILTEMLRDAPATIIGYGNPDRSVCWGKVISASPYLESELHAGEASQAVTTHIAGIYNLENLTAAACAGNYFKISLDRIAASIAAYTPQNNRSQVLQTAENRLLLDYYNANPTAMKESLRNFFEQIQGPKMAILGDMFELGEDAPQEHADIVDLLLTRPDVECMVTGKEFYRAAKDKPGIEAFEKIEDLKNRIAARPPKGLFILIKGSRGMKMEQLTELL